MDDPKLLTTLSDAAYLHAPEHKEHVEAVLASYDNPTGILGELVSQMADAFWWVKIYRAEKNHLVVSEMADRLIARTYDVRSKEAWGKLHDLLTKTVSGQSLTEDEKKLLRRSSSVRGAYTSVTAHGRVPISAGVL